MSPVTLILVYVIVWWLLFFMALPIGVKSQHEESQSFQTGTDPGAPTKPLLKKKILWTSVAALVITTAYYFLAQAEVISFR